MAYLDKQIRALPYGILSKLADQLDMTGPRNWKALIVAMSSSAYKPEQVGWCECEYHCPKLNGTFYDF